MNAASLAGELASKFVQLENKNKFNMQATENAEMKAKMRSLRIKPYLPSLLKHDAKLVSVFFHLLARQTSVVVSTTMAPSIYYECTHTFSLLMTSTRSSRRSQICLHCPCSSAHHFAPHTVPFFTLVTLYSTWLSIVHINTQIPYELNKQCLTTTNMAVNIDNTRLHINYINSLL